MVITTHTNQQLPPIHKYKVEREPKTGKKDIRKDFKTKSEAVAYFTKYKKEYKDYYKRTGKILLMIMFGWKDGKWHGLDRN
jgi:hypothetical protein